MLLFYALSLIHIFSRRNVMNTFDELFDLNVVPIVNENDTVSTYAVSYTHLDVYKRQHIRSWLMLQVALRASRRRLYQAVL